MADINKNAKLAPLAILIGEWSTIGSHPALPGVTLHGKVSFEWQENGAFLVMHSHIDHKDFPDGVAIFGSDDEHDEYAMLYFDERGVSRKYISSLAKNVWKWCRDDSKFSQRYSGQISEDRNAIAVKGEMSRNGKAWEKDLELMYKRIR